MFWTLELASYLEDAPWPATKDELIDYAIRSGAPIEVVENLQELDDEGEIPAGSGFAWASKGAGGMDFFMAPRIVSVRCPRAMAFASEKIAPALW